MIFRLLSYNICRGGRRREQALISVIRACWPDLVILQEATRPDVVEQLAAGTEMAQWAARPRQSLGFMARSRVAHYGWHRPRVSRHAFLEIRPAGTNARLFGVHLSAVHAAWTERRRALELRALLRGIAAHQHGMHVLAGDFNTLAPGELLDIRKLPRRLRALVWLSGGRVRWRTIQMILDAGYADAYRTQSTELGLTFPTWDPHVRLDYVFVPQGSVSLITACEVITVEGVAAASDHFPLLCVLDLPPESTEQPAHAGHPRPGSGKSPNIEERAS